MDHCSICLEPMAPTEAHRGGSRCAHAFCRSCLEGHVRAKVESGRAATVGCLDATCAGKLDPELCRAALPDDVFERWCAALCESMFVGARRTYCPFPDCSEMMVTDDGDGERVTQSECQVCRRLFCAQCGVPWHAGADCAAYRHLGRCDTAREDAMVLEMAEGKRWRRCPRCQFFVEKTDGCLHITWTRRRSRAPAGRASLRAARTTGGSRSRPTSREGRRGPRGLRRRSGTLNPKQDRQGEPGGRPRRRPAGWEPRREQRERRRLDGQQQMARDGAEGGECGQRGAGSQRAGWWVRREVAGGRRRAATGIARAGCEQHPRVL